MSVKFPKRYPDQTDYAGIDYSAGTANFDPANGIHYGVISQHDVLQAWCDTAEGHYGPPTCPKCGNEAKDLDHPDVPVIDEQEDWDDEGIDWACVECRYSFGNEEAFGDEALSWYVDDGEYKAECGEDGDIFIVKSPYFTYAQFCSPCAPGAGHLGNPCENGVKTYCFGHDWFDGGEAQYPVYSVETNELVLPVKV